MRECSSPNLGKWSLEITSIINTSTSAQGQDLISALQLTLNIITRLSSQATSTMGGKVEYTKIFRAITKAGMDVCTITCSLVPSVDNAVYTGGSIEQVFKAWKTLFGQLLYGV